MQGKIDDIQIIARPLWFMILLQCFVALAFLAFPQGIDVLYSLIEDCYHGSFYDTLIKLMSLIISIAFWMISSEFCGRLILFLSDLSSKKLDKKSEKRRRIYIKTAPKILFYFPIVITIIGFVYSFLVKTYKVHWSKEEMVNLFSLFIILGLLLSTLFTMRKMRYGIFKTSHFGKPLSMQARRNILKYHGLYNLNSIEDRMPFRKYSSLFNMFVLLFFISFISILFWAFAPVNLMEKIGSTYFICMGFGVWTVIYTTLDFLSRRKIYGYAIPFKWLAIFFVLFISKINNDHPIRTMHSSTAHQRVSVIENFNRWYHYRNTFFANDSIVQPIIICAEGGALRTGCFSAMLLAQMQEQYPNFYNQIFAFSSVSGGSLGVGFFNALAQQGIANNKYVDYTHSFFSYDFLSPVTGKIVFGEPLNWISPYSINAFDRNIFLEKSWEASWNQLSNIEKDIFGKGYLALHKKYPNMPIHFINSTEVERGLRTVISNAKSDSVINFQYLDFFSIMDSKKDIAFSTAISLSARFPFISSAGALKTNCGKSHFTDGGYIENKGNQTALEILKQVPSFIDNKKVQPIIIEITFFPEDSTCSQSIDFINEFSEIYNCLYNTRAGRTYVATKELERFVKLKNGKILVFGLDEEKMRVPMNWSLSQNALFRVETFCKKIISNNKLVLDSLLK